MALTTILEIGTSTTKNTTIIVRLVDASCLSKFGCHVFMNFHGVLDGVSNLDAMFSAVGGVGGTIFLMSCFRRLSL